MDAVFSYELDAADRIVAVSDEWLAFAAANGAKQLTRDNVLGRTIGQFIAGWEVGDLYTRLFEALRRRGKPVRLPFRCDAPDRRRYMELEVQPLEGGRLRLSGRLLSEEARPRVPLLDPAARRGSGWRVICGICRQIEQADKRWLDAEASEEAPHEEPAIGLPRLSHTICPSCRLMMNSAIGTRSQGGAD